MLLWWGRLSPLPGGRTLFSLLVGLLIPYTGTMRSRVLTLVPGHAQVLLRDRRHVRNHLRSVHAIALANVAEYSTGLAVLSGMPGGFNGILVKLSVDYTKKARGDLLAECKTEVPEFKERTEVPVVSEIRDSSGDIVCTATATWLIGPQT